MGRPVGAKDRVPRRSSARKQAEIAAQGGITPLEVLLTTMRDAWAAAEASQDANDKQSRRLVVCALAEKAAPYCHARLAATEHSGSVAITHEEALAALADEPDGGGEGTSD